MSILTYKKKKYNLALLQKYWCDNNSIHIEINDEKIDIPLTSAKLSEVYAKLDEKIHNDNSVDLDQLIDM